MTHVHGDIRRRLLMSEEKKVNQTEQLVESSNTNTKNEEIKIFGTVESCWQLRVRKEPNEEADVIEIIPCGTVVELLNDNIINGFYSVRTETGDGYCMTDFINIAHPDKE
jgi:hypothetical protein